MVVGAVRSGFVMRECEDGGVGSVGGNLVVVWVREEGRKKGAFSGGLGGSLGLLRWWMVSRWRRVCQRERGTRLRERREWLNWSLVGWVLYSMLSSSEELGSESSKAADIKPSPLSPEDVGAMAGVISSSFIRREGTWVNNVRLFQILIPTLSAWAVARNSPVSENARAVHGLSVRIAFVR